MEKNNHEKPQNFLKAWKKVIAKAWAHKEFKEKLLKNPKAVLRAEGINVPDDVEVVVHPGKKKRWDLFLPEPPSLDVDQLRGTSGACCALAASGYVCSMDGTGGTGCECE